MPLFNPSIHSRAFFALLTILLLAMPVAQANTVHYEGRGISFDYSAKYQLSEETTKHGWKLQLKNGPNSIVINIYDNPLIDGFADLVTNAITKGFEEQQRAISNAQRAAETILLKIKGTPEPLAMDANKYSHTVTIDEQNMKLDIEQTLFFFSYADHGYMVNFTQMNAPDQDLDTLLSSLTISRAQ